MFKTSRSPSLSLALSIAPYSFKTGAIKLALITSILFSAACSQSEEEVQREKSDQAQQATALVKQAHQAQARTSDHPYRVEIAQSAQSSAMVALGGNIIPKTEMTIRAQAPGRVVYIIGEEGTALRSGDIIVDLDESSLVAQKRAAMAGLQRARSQLNNAYIQLDQNIISDGHSSGGGMGIPSMFDKFVTNNMGDAMGMGNSDYDRYASISASRAGVESAKSMVMEAESNIEQINTMFRDKQAIAPEDALILEKMVELGDAVQPGQALVRIGDTSVLLVQVDIPTRLMNGLKTGMTLAVNLNSGSDPVDAEIIRIFPSADVQRNTIRIKLALPQGTQATPGMYVTVGVPDNTRNKLSSISVPSSAIVWRGSQASIYVINSNGQASLRMVRTGSNAADRVAVLSGITEGDRVITTPDTHIRSGMMIQTISTPNQGMNASPPPLMPNPDSFDTV